MKKSFAPAPISSQYPKYSSYEKKRQISDTATFPKRILFFINMIAVSLVNPLLTIPLIGLSLYAPLFFVVAAEAVFRSPAPWTLVDRKYKIYAILIWLGAFLSMIINGITSGGADIETYGVITVFRYAYWLFIFILAIYVIVIGKYAVSLTKVIGWSILVLGLVRWAEASLYSNIGAWTGTRWFSQNGYGFQFSTFSAFLLMLIVIENGWKRGLALGGYAVLLGAAAINGSRGSWVALGTSLVVFLFIVLLSQPRKFSGLLAMLLLAGSASLFIFISSDQITESINRRFSTFENLEQEKSYQFRLVMNQKSMLLFKESPIFGVGSGRFGLSSAEGLNLPAVFGYTNVKSFDGKSSHNSYLGFLAENGLVGSIPFALLLIGLILTGFKSALALSVKNQYWGAAIYAGFIGMSVHMWAISSLTNTATWFIYGLTAAMIILTRAETQEIQKT
jgi:O-antigen ligase